MKNVSRAERRGRPRRCFICHALFVGERPVAESADYAGLCRPCGAFCRERRDRTADLSGRVALVTGARVGIGYATAVRLLRMGAAVHATTRFPHDAALRFAAEPDFTGWSGRLSIHALDLKQILAVELFARHLAATLPRLDVLVNNAAQTIRRPDTYLRRLVEIDAGAASRLEPPVRALVAPAVLRSDGAALVPTGTLFGPFLPPELTEPPRRPGARPDAPYSQSLKSDDPMFVPAGKTAPDGQPADLRLVNSWLLQDDEVSALELLAVHVVNAVAPFLLCSRLKARMASGPPADRFVINVTSAEGRFQARERKAKRHPHTNMAKAALNMMTRTCADDYARHRVYMNAVDPGWVSYQQPNHIVAVMEARGAGPMFDMEDAAARVCDLVIQNALTGAVCKGLLLKDFREADW